jgi:hypothetical protein
MKRGFFLASALFACISCTDDNNVEGLKRASLNNSFTSHMNEKVYVSDTTNSFTLEVGSINDNRCSAHTEYCNDKGLCTVKIKLSNLNNASAGTILSIDNSERRHTDTVVLHLHKKTYQVFLENVNPKPNLVTANNTPKAAEFIIREYSPDMGTSE